MPLVVFQVGPRGSKIFQSYSFIGINLNALWPYVIVSPAKGMQSLNALNELSNNVQYLIRGEVGLYVPIQLNPIIFRHVVIENPYVGIYLFLYHLVLPHV